MRHDRDSLEVGIRFGSHSTADNSSWRVGRRKIVGFCLAFAEPYPAGYEAPAGELCTRIRFMLTTDPHIVFYFARRLTDLHNRKVFMTGGCPVRGFEGSVPYAMARVVDVLGFLQFLDVCTLVCNSPWGWRTTKNNPRKQLVITNSLKVKCVCLNIAPITCLLLVDSLRFCSVANRCNCL